MTLLAQHGYGKGTKIEFGMQSQYIHGAVLSPRDETPANLSSLAHHIVNQHSNATVLMDPQFYVTTITSPKDGNPPAYSYYVSNLTRQNFSLTGMQSFVEDVLNYQVSLPLFGIVSPTISLDDFGDNWSQIAIWMAQHSVSHYRSLSDRRPLYISLVCSETALRSKPHVDEFLNELTTLDTDGFYIVVRRAGSSYSQNFDHQVLANLMYLVYSLGTINGFLVGVGYTDLYGILLKAAGASWIATGWNNNLRQFTFDRFQPSGGGRQARSRYTSSELLNSILLTELDTCHSHGLSNYAMSGTTEDSILLTASSFLDAPWTPEVSTVHHWGSLNKLLIATNATTVKRKLQNCEAAINTATGNYSLLSAAGIPFEVSTGPRHLQQWANAISEFSTITGI